LDADIVEWWTTVARDGTPQTSVISFLWDAGTILFHSRPNTWKLQNLVTNQRVSFHLNCDEIGNQMVAIESDARVDEDAPKSNALPAYLAKDPEPYRRRGMDAGNTADQFPVAVRIRPTRIRAW
jgi:PPOX class probable F420-dependent enzyme